MKKQKQIIIKVNLGKWRLVKCRGTYENGFRPIEKVGEFPPDRVMTAKNNKFYRDTFIRFGEEWEKESKRASVLISNFPYPDHEAKRRLRQK